LRKRVNHIKLVESSGPIDKVGGAQGTLFHMPSDRLLVFLDISSISDSMFVNILKEGVLRVFDLRVAPRFDIGTLNRSRVFDLFNQYHIDYFDIPGVLSVLSRYDVRLNPEEIAPFVLSKIRDYKVPGPNLFLLEDNKRATEFATLLPRSLPAPTKRNWEVLIPNENPFNKMSLTKIAKAHKKVPSKPTSKRPE
jgi:hypothetical protein